VQHLILIANFGFSHKRKNTDRGGAENGVLRVNTGT